MRGMLTNKMACMPFALDSGECVMRQHNDPDVLSQALAEPSRRALLENLRFGARTVTQLVDATALKQPNVSNHLAKMKQQGIVRSERIGRQVFYSLSTPFADVLMRMHEFAAISTPTPAAGVSASGGENHPPMQDGHAASSPSDNSVEHQNRDANDEQALHKTRQSSLDAILTQSREAYFAAVMTGDEEQAVALINSLVAQRLPIETIYLEVFAKSINHIGELYRQGVTDEAHEHMASAITERIMARVTQFYMPVARVSCRAVLGCVADNWHTMGLRMLADGLKTLGWETLFLGANVPTASFIAMAQGMRPDLVIVSCAMKEQREAARELLNGLDAARQQMDAPAFQIAAGGHYFLEAGAEVADWPVDFTAVDLHQFLQVVQARFADNEKRF